jgi:hypothetical protein
MRVKAGRAPRDTNAFLQIPVIATSIDAIAMSSGGARGWVVGSLGLCFRRARWTPQTSGTTGTSPASRCRRTARSLAERARKVGVLQPSRST